MCAAGTELVDTIALVEMAFYAYHGAHPEERVLGQRFVVDLEADTDLQPAGRSDALDDTVDYGALYRTVRDAFPDRTLPGEPQEIRIEIDAEAARAELLGGRDDEAPVARAEIDEEIIRAHLRHLQHLVDDDLRCGYIYDVAPPFLGEGRRRESDKR